MEAIILEVKTLPLLPEQFRAVAVDGKADQAGGAGGDRIGFGFPPARCGEACAGGLLDQVETCAVGWIIAVYHFYG